MHAHVAKSRSSWSPHTSSVHQLLCRSYSLAFLSPANTCKRQTKECDYRSHVASRCTEYHLQVPVTFQQVASQSLESPVQSEELQAAGNILRHYRHAKSNSPEENLITVPCSKQGGKVHCTCTQKMSLVAQLVEGVGSKSCLNSVVSRVYMYVYHTHSFSQ